MPTTLVTGATGLIGSRILQAHPNAKALARKPSSVTAKHPGVQAYAWETSLPVPPEALDDVDVVLHLAGEPVAGPRWTDARKASIRESRVQGTRQVVLAMGKAKQKPRVLVCASAVGYYGNRGDEVLTESSSPGSDFLASVCADWEKEAEAATALGIRVVCLRIGIVLASKGGALDAMLPVFRAGLGGPLGNGKQWMSWIHIDDVIGLVGFAAENDALRGPVNTTAPNPVTNHEFTKALGATLHRPAIVPAPLFALRLALGGFADAVTSSQRVAPKAALAAGYAFKYVDVATALEEVLGAS